MMEKLEREYQKILEAVTFEQCETVELAYKDFWAAREHLCRRFGMDWEDEDLELIMNGILTLEQEIGKQMFFCGIRYARGKFTE